ncbi:MAG: hypothetical protein WAO83_15225 [Fuerstiella sp.]
MKKVITGAVALIIAFSITSGSEVEAARRGNSNRGIFAQRQANGGFFQNMMELERRKNAWLRATFLGQ